MVPLLLIQMTNAAAATFNPVWAMNRNQFIGPTVTQPVQK